MARCLYHPGRLRVRANGDHFRAAGRRERSGSVARSGGHGDGDQGASIPSSDDRLAVGPADDDARRSVRLLSPLLHSQQRHAGDRRRRRRRRRAPARRAALREHSARRRCRRGAGPPNRNRPASAASRFEREGTTAYLKVAYHAPAVGDAGFFPALVLDAVLTGAKGINLWSSFRVHAAAAQRAPLSRARRSRARVDRSPGSSLPTAGAVPVHGFRHRDRRHVRSLPSNRRCCEELDARPRRRDHAGGARAREERSCTPASCSTTTASRTSRISSATSRRSPTSTCSRRVEDRVRAVTARCGLARRGVDADGSRTGQSAGSSRSATWRQRPNRTRR